MFLELFEGTGVLVNEEEDKNGGNQTGLDPIERLQL